VAVTSANPAYTRAHREKLSRKRLRNANREYRDTALKRYLQSLRVRQPIRAQERPGPYKVRETEKRYHMTHGPSKRIYMNSKHQDTAVDQASQGDHQR